MTQDSELQTVAKSAPNYSLYCAAFLERAKPLDAYVLDMNKTASALTADIHAPVTAKRLVMGTTISHIANAAAGLKHSLKNLAITTAATVLPTEGIRSLRDQYSAAAIIQEADERAKFLVGFIGPERVAKLLPQELRTPEAAAHMRQSGHLALQAAIDQSMMLQLPQ